MASPFFLVLIQKLLKPLHNFIHFQVKPISEEWKPANP